jgi:hypothetical protein
MTTTLDGIVEIFQDGERDQVIWKKLRTLLADCDGHEVSDFSDFIWRIYEPILPKSVIFDEESKHELISAITSIFLCGLLAGREHLQRGYEVA